MNGNTLAVIEALANIISKLASGELQADTAEIGVEHPGVVHHTPLGGPTIYRKTAPTVTTLTMRLIHEERR